jgi:glycosyltransferase involved in cell wall biosynthesis
LTNKLLILSDFESSGGTKTYFKQLIDFYKQKSVLEKCICINRNSSLTKTELENIKKYFEVKYLPKFYSLNNIKKFPILFFIFRTIFCFFIGLQYEKIIVSTGNYFHFITFSVFKKNKFYYILHTYPSMQKYWRWYNLKQLSVKLYYLFIAKLNFKLITVSQFSKTQIHKCTKINLDKISVVYNYVLPQGNICKDKKNEKTVLTVGHVEVWKNPFFWLQTAITICNKFSNVFFIWVGSGSLRKHMIEQTPFELSHRILWVEGQENVFDFYKKADIYFQPSLIESFGLAVTEAMSFGLPCVVSNVGGLPEVIDDNVNGFIYNLDSNEDALTKINFLINNEKDYSRLSQNARIKIHSYFSNTIWSNQMNKTLNEK